MNEVRLTLEPRQRALFLVAGAVLFVLGVVSIALGYFQAGIVTGPALIALYFTSGRFATVLTPQGLVAVGLTTQQWAWGEIAQIEAKKMLGSRYVRLTLAGGKKKRLRVPVTGLWQRDHAFDAKVATIWQWWAGATGQGQMTGHGQPYGQVPQQGWPVQQPYAYPQGQQAPAQQYPGQVQPQPYPGQPHQGQPYAQPYPPAYPQQGAAPQWPQNPGAGQPPYGH
ncbi:hypothetical protein [Yinghuangia soli]|uniref:PH domain-containing protein n=1 Tax=Yinghuangia soli TaxID=2908204 RepID=A0AA41PZQ3_9ACTN|nr:hypothetical protein [Yinghuangia soli]MCF2528641.1 hypothetical protein [Yinghuangia soli]